MKVLLLLSLVGLSLGQRLCPPKGVFYPCTCIEPLGITLISCTWDRETINLKQIFDYAADVVDTDFQFDSLHFNSIPIVEVEENTVERLKFRRIQILNNDNLEYISPSAFNVSRNSTVLLELHRNINLVNETVVFDFVNSFSILNGINIQRTPISSVPDRILRNHPRMRQVWLEHNAISYIGSQAFPQAVVELRLRNNSIPSEGLPEDAFEGINPAAECDLRCNKMEFMEQKSFKSLMDGARRVQVGGLDCGGEGEGLQRFYCDERANWLCDNEERYAPKLTGFMCKEGSGVNHIWEYCAARKIIYR